MCDDRRKYVVSSKELDIATFGHKAFWVENKHVVFLEDAIEFLDKYLYTLSKPSVPSVCPHCKKEFE